MDGDAGIYIGFICGYSLFLSLLLNSIGINFIMDPPFSLTIMLFSKFFVFYLIYNDP